MPVENHALLSASSAHRWLYCPMLPRLEADYLAAIPYTLKRAQAPMSFLKSN